MYGRRNRNLGDGIDYAQHEVCLRFLNSLLSANLRLIYSVMTQSVLDFKIISNWFSLHSTKIEEGILAKGAVALYEYEDLGKGDEGCRAAASGRWCRTRWRCCSCTAVPPLLPASSTWWGTNLFHSIFAGLLFTMGLDHSKTTPSSNQSLYYWKDAPGFRRPSTSYIRYNTYFYIMYHKI